MTSLFCRHNRFTADCPICSRGTVLDGSASAGARRRAAVPAPPARGERAPTRRPGQAAGAARSVRNAYASAGPYEREDGRYEVRLERVPGGLRLASWAGGQLERRAPVIAAADLVGLVAAARDQAALPDADLDRLEAALTESPVADAGGGPAASPGRAGELKEELRIERLAAEDGAPVLRIARWLLRPGPGSEWELQEAPVMMPAARLGEAAAGAARRGLLEP